ncbi:MAG: hypothetical protein JWM11_1365 [Planctomycetaceae bacterium]|nr:hypothetical protein [Planctomycetaceae bacterium]
MMRLDDEFLIEMHEEEQDSLGSTELCVAMFTGRQVASTHAPSLFEVAQFECERMGPGYLSQ